VRTEEAQYVMGFTVALREFETVGAMMDIKLLELLGGN